MAAAAVVVVKKILLSVMALMTMIKPTVEMMRKSQGSNQSLKVERGTSISGGGTAFPIGFPMATWPLTCTGFVCARWSCPKV